MAVKLVLNYQKKMATSRNLPQSKEALLKSYQTRLKDDVKCMLENFEGKISKASKLYLILYLITLNTFYFRNSKTCQRWKWNSAFKNDSMWARHIWNACKSC